MKTEAKESIKKILVICFASFLMALNIKSFVRTGGLYPGGATGLALLIQRAADMFLHITIPYTIVNILLNAIPVNPMIKIINIVALLLLQALA